MSTTQILRALHALPQKEQWRIFARLGLQSRLGSKEKSKRSRSTSRTLVKSAGKFPWKELHAWRQRTYGMSQRPNPVLAERDEAPF